MSSSNNSSNNWIFSGVGVVLVALLLVIVNSIVAKSRAGIDATEYKLHTLTDGTKQILEDLEDQLKVYDSEGERYRLEIRLFATRDKDLMPPPLAEYADKVEAFLREYEALSGDRIKLKVINPVPDSQEALNADMNGIFPFPVSQEDRVYIGLSVSSLDKIITIPVLIEANDSLLEYEVSRAIVEVARKDKPTIGLMSSYEMNGGPSRGQPWDFRIQLEREYNVQDVPMTVAKIDPKLDALLVIHPAGIEDATQFAIDQYLLGGGKLLVMLDSFSFYNHAQAAARRQQAPNMPPPPASSTSSSLPDLLDAWGVKFEKVNVVADLNYYSKRFPFVMTSIPAAGVDSKHPATAQMSNVEFFFSGAFYGSGADGLEMSVLVETSEGTGTVSPYPIIDAQRQAAASRQPLGRMLLSALNGNLEPSESKLPLAISLKGEFKTAYQDGPPKDRSADDPQGEAAAKESKLKGPFLKRSQKPGTVVLVADTDMIADMIAVEYQMTQEGNRVYLPSPNNNLAFISNLTDYVAGNENLLAMRSRGDITRRFTEYEKMKEKMNEDKQKKLDALVEENRENAEKFSDIRAKQIERTPLNTEDREVISKYEDSYLSTQQSMVTLRRELREGVNSIEARWKWLNIALIPGLVGFAAGCHLLVRRVRTSAR